MVNKTMILSDSFWNCLVGIEGISKEISLNDFCQLHNCENHIVLESIEFLNGLSLKVDLVEKDSEVYLKPISPKYPINVQFKLTEWFALQTHFALLNKYKEKSFSKTLSNKILDIQSKYPRMSLFSPEPNTMELSDIQESTQKYIDQIETIQDNQKLCLLKSDDKEYKLFIHKVVYLDGSMKVISEDVVDKCLLVFDLNNIDSIKEFKNNNFNCKYSVLEIVDFIEAFRAVSGNEIRAIFKISNSDNINLQIEHQFLSNPYITSNSEGSIIWAVGIEICTEMFEWIFSLDDQIEILDPLELKRSYSEYKKQNKCERHKKAS